MYDLHTVIHVLEGGFFRLALDIPGTWYYLSNPARRYRGI